MSIWILAAVVVQIFTLLSIAILWIRQMRPPKEDPRLSRGLQLLQSKIAVLEDLSDRTETQVRQLTQILEERARALQTKILNAEEMIIKIEHSMRKSLDVAEIFQDKIPHEEIIGRSQTQKYVTAAKLAHDGFTIDEIIAQVGLPRSEVEFITKVNREELTFDPALLPEWAKPREDVSPATAQQTAANQAVEQVFQTRGPDLTSLHRIEEDFKVSVRQAEEFERREAEKIRQAEERLTAFKQTATRMTQGLVNSAENIVRQSGEVLKTAAERAGEKMLERANERASERAAQSASERMTGVKAAPVVRKIEFPRI